MSCLCSGDDVPHPYRSRAIGSSCFFARSPVQPQPHGVPPAYQLGEVVPRHLWPLRMRSTASPPFTSYEGVSYLPKSSGVTWESTLGYGQHRPENIRFADELEKEALCFFQREPCSVYPSDETPSKSVISVRAS